MKKLAIATIIAGSMASQISAQSCGGDFRSFVDELAQEAREMGYSRRAVSRFFDGVAHDPKVIRADRAQGVFQLPFVEFARRLISQHRIDHGKKNRT